MNLSDLEDLLDRAREHPKTTALLVSVVLLLLLAGAYTTGFMSEMGRQAADPTSEVVLENPLESGAPDGEWRSYEFHLTQDPRASLELGQCPGDACYRISLGGLDQERSALIQHVALTGAGFGYRAQTRPRFFAEFRSKFRIQSPSSVSLNPATGAATAKIALNHDHEMWICTEALDLRFRVADDHAGSLRMSLLVKPGTWQPTETPEKCAWFEELRSAA